MPDAPTTRSRIHPAWRKPGLLALHLGAALLLAAWLFSASRDIWDRLDLALFKLLNGSLAVGGLWADFWAVANVRPFDLVSAALMLLFLCRRDWLFRQSELRPALFTFLSLLLVSLVIRVLLNKLVLLCGWQHHSPSLQVEGCFRLSEHHPYLAEHFELKDSSKRSFPGDHASVVMLWALFLSQFARGGKLAAVLGVTTLLMLPRLGLLRPAWAHSWPMAWQSADGPAGKTAGIQPLRALPCRNPKLKNHSGEPLNKDESTFWIRHPRLGLNHRALRFFHECGRGRRRPCRPA